MSVNISKQGVVTDLDGKGEPEQPLTEKDLNDKALLVRLARSMLSDIQKLKRRWAPQRIDFEDRDVVGDGVTKHRFEHRLGGRVRYWVVDWQGLNSPNMTRDPSSDSNTLVLISSSYGTMTLRVEVGG